MNLGFHVSCFSLVSFEPSIEFDKYMTSLTVVLENFPKNKIKKNVILIIVTKRNWFPKEGRVWKFWKFLNWWVKGVVKYPDAHSHSNQTHLLLK
jgi:hypothetical protein